MIWMRMQERFLDTCAEHADLGWNLPLTNKKMRSDASDMLAAALEQMDGIIAGSKALEYSNGIFDYQSPTSPFMGSL